MEDEGTPAPESLPQEGSFCTLVLIRKADGGEISRYPIDGEKFTFGRDVTNDVRLYYTDVSRIHAEVVFDKDRKAHLTVLGRRGVEVNGVLLGEGSEIALNQGDTIEIRKKRFRIGFPSEEEVEVFKQEEHHTPRRNRPSHRFSLLPKDLLYSPYAKQDALEQEQQNQLAAASPLKRGAFVGSPRPSSRLAQAEEQEQEQEEQIAVAAPAQEQEEEEVALDSSEEESEQESELEEHSEKENVPVRSTPAKTTPLVVLRGYLTPQAVAKPSSSRAGAQTGARPGMMVGTFEKPAKRVVLQSPVIVQPEVEVDLASQSEGEVVEEKDDDSFEDEDEEEEMEVASEAPRTPSSVPLPPSTSTPYTPFVSKQRSFAQTPSSVPLPPSANTPYTTKKTIATFAADPATPSSVPLPPSDGRTPYAAATKTPGGARGRTVNFAATTPVQSSSTPRFTKGHSTPFAKTPKSVPLPPSADTPYHQQQQESSSSSSPSPAKTPRSVPLPASSQTPYHAHANTPKKVVVVAQPKEQTPKSLGSARKVGGGGPSSLRKAILMRSARKVMLEERERDAAARLRDEEEEEEEVEENGDGEVVDPASVALPESPMVGGYTPQAPTPVQHFISSPSVPTPPRALDFSNAQDSESEDDEQDQDEEELLAAAAAEDEANYEDVDESSEEEEEEDEEELDPASIALPPSMPGTPATPFQSTLARRNSFDASAITPSRFASATGFEDESSDDEDDLEVERSLIEENEESFEEEDVEEEEEEPVVQQPSTPKSVPVSSRAYYTPQAVAQSGSYRENLTRTMGPPVRVAPSSMHRPRVSLGMPIRVPKVQVVEDEEKEEVEEEKFSQRQSTAEILSSAPRQLAMPSSVDFTALYSSPRKLMSLASADNASDGSDEEGAAVTRTPLQSLAKKAEQLRRKSMARQSVGGAGTSSTDSPKRSAVSTPFLSQSPFRLAIPARPTTIALSQISASPKQEDQPQAVKESIVAVASSSSKPSPATPDLSSLKHWYSIPANAANATTPRLEGIRRMQQLPAEASTPDLKGFRDLLRTPNQPTSSLDAHFTGVGAMFARPSPIGEDPMSSSGGAGFDEKEEEEEEYAPEDLYDDGAEEQHEEEAAPVVEEQDQEEEEVVVAEEEVVEPAPMEVEEEDVAGDVTEEEEEEIVEAAPTAEAAVVEEDRAEVVAEQEPEQEVEEVEEEEEEDEDMIVVEISPKRPARATKASTTSSASKRTTKASSTTPKVAPAPAVRRGRNALKSSTDSAPAAEEEVVAVVAPKARVARGGRKVAAPKVVEKEEEVEEEVLQIQEEEEEEVAPAPAPKATRGRKAAAPKKAVAVVEKQESEEEVEEPVVVVAAPKATKGRRAAAHVEEAPVASSSKPVAVRKGRTAAATKVVESTSTPAASKAKATRTTKRVRTPSPPPAEEEDPIDSIGPDEPSTPAQPTVRAARKRVTSKEKKEEPDEEDEEPVAVVSEKPKPRGRPAKAKPVAAVDDEPLASASSSSTRSRNTLSATKVAAAAALKEAIEVVAIPKRRGVAKKVVEKDDEEDKENSPVTGTPAAYTSRAKASTASKSTKTATASTSAAKRKVAAAAAAVVEEPKVARATRSRK